ncbi:MAG TPA: hypothetical protein PKW90_18180, partial [Myxococcota bacterium]|nr:hypothetical protein [Myxococcota bacterium]
MIEELKRLLAERQVLLEAMGTCVSVEHVERIRRLFQLLDGLLSLLERKNLSIARLRQLCFGAATESARNLCGRQPGREPRKSKARGHGRNSHRRERQQRNHRNP